MNEFDAYDVYNYLIDSTTNIPIINNTKMAIPEQFGMIKPKFLGSIEDSTQKQQIYADINFHNSIRENNSNWSTPYGFNSIVEEVTEKPKEESVNNVNVDNLVEKDNIETYESVGLPMDNLIIDEQPIIPNYVSTGFDNLISNYTPNYDLKFGVQAIPVDMDRSMLPKPISQEDLHINKDEKPTNKRISNWFSRLIDQRGEEYITSGRLTIEEVSKNAERIIDDMISGRIDYDKFGKYIILPVIIETLINYCSNKLAINKALSFSLGYIYNDYVEKANLIDDPERYSILMTIDDSLARDITQSIAIVNQDINIYTILFNRLSYVNYTKNVSNLYSLINELNVYKKQMKKRY